MLELFDKGRSLNPFFSCISRQMQQKIIIKIGQIGNSIASTKLANAMQLSRRLISRFSQGTLNVWREHLTQSHFMIFQLRGIHVSRKFPFLISGRFLSTLEVGHCVAQTWHFLTNFGFWKILVLYNNLRMAWFWICSRVCKLYFFMPRKMLKFYKDSLIWCKTIKFIRRPLCWNGQNQVFYPYLKKTLA